MKRRVVFLGPPASGKGTVASQLKSDFGFSHVSSGHWLRREIELGTEIGRQVQVFLDKGELAPDELVLEFMEHRLQAELAEAFLLDGFPRTVAQAKALDEWLVAQGAPIEAVIFYECPESLILDRVTGRRTCARCERIYHVRNRPPQTPGRCDLCGAALIQREDDTEPVLRQRLKVYVQQTEPLVDYYREQGKLKVVDATLPSGQIYAASIEALKQ